MTETEINKTLAKIQALLAKAESTNHPEEAKAFSGKAAELMAKYAVSDEALRGYRNARVEEIGVSRIDFPFSPYQAPREQLLGILCRHNDCRVVFVKGVRYDQGKRIPTSVANVFGFPRDREFTEMLYTSLLLQAETEFRSESTQALMFAETSHPGHRIKWRNAFMTGYVWGISARLAEVKRLARREATNSTVGMGLVLANKDALVSQAVASTYGKLSFSRSSAGQGGGSGRMAGADAAQRADIGNRAAGSGSKRQVGA